MTSENERLVLDAFASFQGERFDAASMRWREDARLSGPPDWPESAVFEGRDAVMGQFRRLGADWHTHGFDDLEVVVDDGSWVVVRFIWRVEGASSGVPVETQMAGAYRIEDGLIAEAHFRRDLDEALRIAGHE